MTRALILAAGRGSRLKHLTEDRPKGLVELHGQPLIAWQLHALRAAGISQIALVGGYRAEALERFRLPTFLNARWSETNMVRSLIAADHWLSAAPTVISYSDIFYDAATVTHLAADPADLAISYDRDWLQLWSQRFADPLSDAETFAADERGIVRDIGRKPSSLDEVRGQYMGLLKFTPAGWSQIRAKLQSLDPARCDKLDMTSMLRLMITDGAEIKAVPRVGPWGEIDSETDLSLYDGQTGGAKLPPSPGASA